MKDDATTSYLGKLAHRTSLLQPDGFWSLVTIIHSNQENTIIQNTDLELVQGTESTAAIH